MCLRKNSNAIIYNQCANCLLEHAVKSAKGQPQKLLSIEEKILPPILKPGDIDCIVTGFPW
jgi:DNA (cytosine-5)-methyltransferase 1